MKFSIEEILRDKTAEPVKVQQEERTQEKPAYTANAKFKKDMEDATSSIDYEADDLMDIGAHRRARTTITAWQRNELEELFTKQRYPTLDNVEHLSEQLGLPQYVIKVWFQNRRAKFRKEGRKKSSRALPSVSLPKPHLNIFPHPCLPHFNSLQHLRIPILPPEISAMNQLLIQQRCSLTIDSLGHDMGRKHHDDAQSHPSTKGAAVIRRETSYSTVHCNQTEELQGRSDHCNIDREKSLQECCCMGCRLGTFYTKY